MFHWRILPGLTIQSNFRWTLPTMVAFLVVAIIGIFLLWHSRPEDRRALLLSNRHRLPLPLPHKREEDPRRHPPSSHRFSRPPSRLPTSSESSPSFIPTKRRRRRLTKRQKQLVLDRYGGRCAWCHRVVRGKPWLYHLDHIQPLSTDPLGHQTSRLNGLHNYQPLCVEDHAKKCWLERRAGLYHKKRGTQSK